MRRRTGDRVRRRADDVQRAARRPGPGRTTTCRRCGCACPAARRCRSRCCARSRRRSAARCSRATGCRRPRRSRRSTTRTGSARPGSIGTPIEGVEMRVVDDDRRRGPAGRGRRDRDPRPQRHEGLLAAPGGDRRGHLGRRLVPHRRHRPRRRGRLLLHRRPQEGPDHPRRLQRLPAGDRGGAVRAPGRRRGRRDRRAAPDAGRGGRRRGRAEAGRDGHRRRAARLRQGAGRGVQVPAARVVRRRPAQGPDRARSSSARSSCRPT